MKLINLTPHVITLVAPDGAFTPIEPSGTIARVAERHVAADDIHGWPCRVAAYGAVEGLPEPQDGVVYIASAMVRDAAQRDDVVSPDTGIGAVRDAAKQIIGTRGFVRRAAQA